MEGKERIIELKIEDDDLVSGVDQISLVDEPAIEYDWIAFKKEEENFCVPEGEEDKYLEYLHSVGETEKDLIEDGWVEVESHQMSKSDFAAISSNPNDSSVFDTDDTRVRFRYGLNSIARGPAIVSTSRRFCREMISAGRVYRYEDIERADNGMGSSALIWRGSYNCRHQWFKIVYKKEGRIINKARVRKNREPDTPNFGDAPFGQPSTLTGKGIPKGFNKENFTLPLFENEQDAIDYSKLLQCEEGAHPHEIEGVTLWMPCASHPEDMDIDVSGLPPYVDECPDCEKKKKRDQYESYDDYPKAASENAKIALRYAEENGWGSCGTAVGKQRANQLAKGEKISKDTISRMASFERHRKNSDKELGDGCGRLMWLAWGGDEGIEWAQRKLESLKEEMIEPNPCQPGYEAIGTKIKDGREVPNCVPVQNSKAIFSFKEEDEQMVVVGPAMIPNKKIVRGDMFGNKYYVYFSEETIKQIAEKFMKRGYTRDDQHDIMHNGPGEKDVFVAESWIIEDPEHDKSRMYGFDDLPKGTWMTKMKINNKDIWDKVKSGELRGFSVSGYFEEYERNANELQFLKELAEILKKA